IATTAWNPTNTSPIPVMVTFSETVTGFDATDLTLTNATASNFMGSGAGYSFDLVPSGQGAVSVSVAANKAVDAANNGNTASNTLSLIYDNVAPSVILATTASDPTNTSPIPVTVTFSENVTGFDARNSTRL